MPTRELSKPGYSPTQTQRAWPWLAAVGACLVVGLGYLVYQRSSMAQAPTPLAPAPIDGDRAFGYLEQICALGPRPAGSEANGRQRAMVAAHFKANGGAVREQAFTGRDPLSGAEVKMANLIGSWFPDRADRIVIGVHYDTRPFPDMDPDPKRRRGPFLGANDGASGVALLMEIAHHLADLPTEWGVDLVLFDGEELVYDRVGDYFLGSKEFARQYQAEQDRRRDDDDAPSYVGGLVLDMVGDKDLRIDKEQYSIQLAPGLVRQVWAVAKGLEARAFRDRVGPAVLDDHLALNNAGIPSIDLIDFDYPEWHTSRDLPDRCSASSLAEVGRVVTAWLALPRARKR